MKKSVLITAATLGICIFTTAAFAQSTKSDTAKQNGMSSTTVARDTSAKDIVSTLANVAEETTLVSAVKAANLDTELKGAGPFTVLAPNNDAFNAVSKTKLDSLMKDPVKLQTTLKAHVISGKYDKAALIKVLKDGKGKGMLKTIDGQTLILSVKDKKLAITDTEGNTVEVTSFDTPCTNGLIDGINGVLMAK